jgi:hypothetical protein
MIESTFLSIPELAERWKASARQILEHGINRTLPVLFAFEGLAFDQADRWLMSHGAHDEISELEAKTKWVASSEAHLRRNAAGKVDEFSRLDQHDVVSLRQSINQAQDRIQELGESLSRRDRARLDCQFMGYMRAPPRVLWDLQQQEETAFPRLAFHPQSDIQLANVDGKIVWEGRMMTLEPGVGGAWRDRLRVSDLLIPMAAIKMIERPNIDKTETPTRPKSVASQQEDAILEAINLRGAIPLALPPFTPKSGIKSEIKRAFLSKPQSLFTEKTFDTAWTRLASSGRIAYAAKQSDDAQF